MPAMELDAPVAQADVSESSTQEGGKEAARPIILVVDDSPIDRKLATSTLERHANVRIITADNGRAALLAIERQMPTAVLTDMQMPELGGLELTEILREKYPQVPVILMTNNGSEEIAYQALKRGAAFYVPKKNLSRDLPAAIERVLQNASGDRRRVRILDYLRDLDCTMEIDNDPAMVPQLVAHFQEHALRMGVCDSNTKVRLGISLEEALLNSIYHGNLELSSDLRQDGSDTFQRLATQRQHEQPYAPRRVHLQASLRNGEARFTLRDEGPGFDVSKLPDPTDPENLLKLSGRGVLLIMMFMDEVKYNDKGNELRMTLRKKQ